jgi:hypothetical protein
MISENECIDIILEKFPGFKGAWQEHLDWWGGETRGFCNDMSAFSNYVIDLLHKNKKNLEIKTIFLFIEELMTRGTEEVQEATATCFLENLINATSWGTASAGSFVHLLGAESRKYCKAWDEFTGVKTEGLWDEK